MLEAKYRMARAARVMVLLAVLSVPACAGSSSTDSGGFPRGRNSYDVATRYPHPGCELQGASRYSITVVDGITEAIDLGSDGTIDGLRRGSRLFLRAPELLAESDGGQWLELASDEGAPATALFRQTTLSGGYVLLFSDGDPLSTVQGLISRGRSSPARVNGGTVEWGPSDEQIDHIIVKGTPGEVGFAEETAFTLRAQALEPSSAPADAVPFEELPARTALFLNPRLVEACGQLATPDREALRDCIDQVPEDVSVARWMVGRNAQQAMNPPECE